MAEEKTSENKKILKPEFFDLIVTYKDLRGRGMRPSEAVQRTFELLSFGNQ